MERDRRGWVWRRRLRVTDPSARSTRRTVPRVRGKFQTRNKSFLVQRQAVVYFTFSTLTLFSVNFQFRKKEFFHLGRAGKQKKNVLFFKMVTNPNIIVKCLVNLKLVVQIQQVNQIILYNREVI